jgi:SAM-dependent methyltransferase
MGWKRALIVPHLLRWGVRAPREVDTRWDRYWAGIGATGDGGDVLWDASGSDEPDRYAGLLAAHADPDLPVVDVGCGNGRFTLALAARFPRVVGVDLAPHAVALARAEAAGAPGAEFRVVDMTGPGAGRRLRAELGECSALVRGVLHVLDPAARRRLAVNVGDLVGPRAAVLVAETDHRGPVLGYLEHLGAGPRGLPAPLARVIAAGLPRPAPFGAAELADCFPAARWERLLTDAAAEISVVPMRRPGVAQTVPGHVALLRPR